MSDPESDHALHFRAEDKGRKLVYRTELGATVGDRYVVTKIEMGVRLPADAEGRDAAYAELNRQVTALHALHVAGETIPRHLTEERHRGRVIRQPTLTPEQRRALEAPPE